MRRAHTFAISVALGALFVGACGQPPGTTAKDTLYLKRARGIAAISPGAQEPSLNVAGAVPSSDWSTVVRGRSRRGSTRLTALDVDSGFVRWERQVRGDLRVKIVSPDGSLVALSPQDEPFYRDGRRRTVLAIHGSRFARPQFVSMEGNYEPEAFSTDGKSLFVIRYLPARDPQRYQVRRLDLMTEKVEAVYTPDAHLQQAMGGTARIQAASPDGSRLYTLYTVRHDDGTRHAFIHVLALDKLWAHCIDLPQEFATTPERATAMVVSPDGRQLFVANSEADAVAVIDTQSLSVEASEPVDHGGRGKGYAVHDGRGTLYLAGAQEVVALDTSRGFREIGSWNLFRNIRGLQLSADLRRVYAAVADRVVVIDPRLDEVVKSLDPPGVRRISELGPTMPSPIVTPEPSDDGVIKCAC